MKEKTKTWLDIAQGDLEFAESIIQSKKRFHYAVHFCHQAIEKILKAIVQEHTNQTPKRTHNFKALCQQANIQLPNDLEIILVKLAPHYLASKYPEDIEKLYKTYTLSYATALFRETKELFEWLKQYLKSKK